MPLSNWTCKAKDCQNKIRQSIKDMITTNRKKKGDNSTTCPDSLLCYHHHTQHTKGTDVTLESGKVKQRPKHKKTNANAV